MRVSAALELIFALSTFAVASSQIWNPTWPIPPDYRFGPCMQEVYEWFGNNNELSCTAKEVYANSVTCDGCPATCTRGELIVVNVSASIHFNSDRYDPALYIARTSCDPTNNCALESSHCAVDTLGPDDGANHPGHIFSNDQKREMKATSLAWDIICRRQLTYLLIVSSILLIQLFGRRGRKRVGSTRLFVSWQLDSSLWRISSRWTFIHVFLSIHCDLNPQF